MAPEDIPVAGVDTTADTSTRLRIFSCFSPIGASCLAPFDGVNDVDCAVEGVDVIEVDGLLLSGSNRTWTTW